MCGLRTGREMSILRLRIDPGCHFGKILILLAVHYAGHCCPPHIVLRKDQAELPTELMDEFDVEVPPVRTEKRLCGFGLSDSHPSIAICSDGHPQHD